MSAVSTPCSPKRELLRISYDFLYLRRAIRIDLDGLRTIRAMQKQTVCRELNTRLATASQHPVCESSSLGPFTEGKS